MDSELSTSSDEADAAAVAGAGTLAELEASLDHDTLKEPDAPSYFVTDLEGVPVSVRSSSDWEAVITSDATVLGVALGPRAAREGVEVPGDTYSGSRSSSKLMTMRADEATNIDCPRAHIRSFLGAIVDSTCKASILVRVVANKTSETIRNKTLKIVCHCCRKSNRRRPGDGLS